MIPILYDKTETTFTSNGVGALTDALSCEVTEERNGAFELEMEYPITGQWFDNLSDSMIIKAVPAVNKSAEPFRIYKITKPIDGKVTIYAEHISYQLSCIPMSKFTATGIQDALTKIKSNSQETNPFTFYSDINNTTSGFSVTKPASVRSMLGGTEGSLLDIFGGEYEFTGYTVKLLINRGANNGVTLRYGKNITDFEQEENIANTITGIYPYYSSNDVYVELPEKTLDYTTETIPYPYKRTVPYDFSSYFENTAPTVAQLRSAAQSYLSQSGIGIPEVNITLSFVDLQDGLETVNLCDTVNVFFEPLNVSTQAKVTKTEYDVLKDRYKKVTIGTIKSNLSSVLADGLVTEQFTAEMRASMENAVASATRQITGQNGGHVYTSIDSDGKPQAILIMDADNYAEANKIWQWNLNGLGYSDDGGTTYKLAMTQDGAIVADFISTGKLKDANNKYSLNMSTGTVNMKSAYITGGNINISSSSSTYDNLELKYGNYSTKMNPTRFEAKATDGTVCQMQGKMFLCGDDDTGNHIRIYLGKASDDSPMLQFRDSSGTVRVQLTNSSLAFFNSSGTQTAIYPA